MAAKSKGGRPSKYSSKFCEMLIEHGKSGLSFEAFGGVVGVCKETLYGWTRKHKEFLDAKKLSEAYSQMYWEKLGLAGTVGKIPGFNATVWIFNMKNRFGWRDRQDITSGEEKIQGQIIKIEIPKNGRDG